MTSTTVSEAPAPRRTLGERYLLHVLKSSAPSKWKFVVAVAGWGVGGPTGALLLRFLSQAGFLDIHQSWHMSFILLPFLKMMYEVHKCSLHDDSIMTFVVAPDIASALTGINRFYMNNKQLHDRLGADEMLRVRKTFSLLGDAQHAIPTEVVQYLTDIGQRLRESGIPIHDEQESKVRMRVMSTAKASKVKALLSGYAPSAKLLPQDTSVQAARLDVWDKASDEVVDTFLSCARTDRKS